MTIEDLHTGTDKRIEIECSDATKTELLKAMADIDTDMTYEEFIIAAIRLHSENPTRLGKHHY